MTNIALDYHDFSEIRAEEWFEGLIMKMSPQGITHGRVVRPLEDILDRYFANSSCELYSDVYVYFTKKTRLAPDFAVVCDPGIIKGESIHGVPNLVVEVLSPSTFKKDKNKKKATYEKFGVPEYWIVDSRNFSIEVHLLKDGKLELDDIFILASKEALDNMTAEEMGNINHILKSKQFGGLIVDLYKVFQNVLPEDY
ncbi:MAG: Uma2 family endonuclease [Clostridiales bacterium]|jgi:Uma2 family endonuclease|nr:Uma2 family endonuclease [Clostridiales bacterium]